MASDYVMRFGAQDNASSTINKIKENVSDLGKQGSTALERIEKRFEQVKNSTAPLKTRLAEVKNLMAQMNETGLSDSHSQLYTEMAQSAGNMKDAIADASNAMGRFASDTHGLDAMVQAANGVAAAFSVGAGVMGLFGVESEKTQNMILKVQSALAILNGVQAISNALNKDSVLIQKLQSMRITINTALRAAETTATTASTGALSANLLVQKAWNIAKAIGNALLGNWKGLLLVGGAALATYALSTNEAKESQENFNATLEEGEERQRKYQQVAADTYASLMTKYSQLKASWQALSNEHQKNKWIKENKTQLEELGISVTNVNSVEDAFHGKTNAVVESFIRRAKAAASLAKLTELYREQMELLDQKEEALNKHKLKPGDPIPQGAGNWSSEYGYVNSSGTWVLSEEGADKWNKTRANNTSEIKVIDKKLAANENEQTKVLKNIEAEAKNNPVKTHTPSYTPPKTTGHSTTTGTNKPEAKEGSLANLEKQLSDAKERQKTGNLLKGETNESINKLIEDLEKKIENKKLELGIDINYSTDSLDALEEKLSEAKKRLSSGIFNEGESVESLKNLITTLQKEVSNKRVELGFDKSEAEKNLEEYKKKLEEIQKSQSDIKFEKPDNKGSYEKAIENAGKKPTNKIQPISIDTFQSSIKEQMDWNDKLLEQLEAVKKKYEEIGATGEQSYKDVTDKISQVTDENKKLGNTAEEVEEKRVRWEKQKEKIEEFKEATSQISGSLSSVADGFRKMGNESAASFIQLASSTAEAIGTIIPLIQKVFFAKQAEAVAGGVSSVATDEATPWYVKIGAMATIVAEILSLFGQFSGSFAEGGTIRGSSAHGDRLFARVNSGEMILNQKQQNNLFKAIDEDRLGGAGSLSGTVRIKGSDIYLSLSNYSKGLKKLGKNTGIS